MSEKISLDSSENVSKRQNTLWKFAVLLLCKVLENKVSIQ